MGASQNIHATFTVTSSFVKKHGIAMARDKDEDNIRVRTMMHATNSMLLLNNRMLLLIVCY